MPIPAPPPSLTVSAGPSLSEAGDVGAFTDTGHVFNFNGGKNVPETSTLVLGGVAALIGILWIIKR